jgi:hypothetical protein
MVNDRIIPSPSLAGISEFPVFRLVDDSVLPFQRVINDTFYLFLGWWMIAYSPFLRQWTNTELSISRMVDDSVPVLPILKMMDESELFIYNMADDNVPPSPLLGWCTTVY